ncbi:HlyD family efflux transporter periplasmic adaptor subunit [bacterium]|nr:MAG: HlyD family efflux transporter periplasmic adaptor subunit [bacterium]
MKSKFLKFLTLAALMGLILSACTPAATSTLSASGNLSASDVSIAPELSGKVASIAVEEGQTVTNGETLFKLDDAYYRAQRDQADAAVQSAEAAVAAAQKQAASAQAQYELALQGARAQERQTRTSAWGAQTLDDFRPGWYFQKEELIQAAEKQITEAESALSTAQTDLQAEQKKASTEDFVAAEVRLAQAQTAYETAQMTLTQAQAAGQNELETAAQDKLDAAEAEFTAARLDYEHMLSTAAADSIIQSRARVAVAQSALDNARDTLTALQTGDQNPQVLAARAAADAAASSVSQAEAGLEQARQALKLAELQLERTTVTAPMDGVILTRNLEVGEMAAAGGAVMRMARLDTLELSVYIPEDLYGRVKIDDTVPLSVDSYPGQIFTGKIIHIADEAEFTPRNVQTEQGRTSSVYAVKIKVENPDLKLKPGMPADVEFNLH